MLQCFPPSLSLSLPPPAQCLHWRNQLKGPLGPQFKHCNLQHMAHFQLPRSIKAIYCENVAKFPKVSTQFIAECLVYHIKNQLSGLHSPCRDFPSKISKAFESSLRHFIFSYRKTSLFALPFSLAKLTIQI